MLEGKEITEAEQLLVQAFSEADELKQKLLASDLSDELRNLGNRYEIGTLLGEGMVKRVYEAHDQMMNRKVAFATMKEDNSALLNDFLNEARLSSILEHPYIAPVYDMGFQNNGSPFFVMKLYEGQSLCEELAARQDRTIGIEEQVSWLLNIFLNVCEAVAYAHSLGVLHLDIKPANIRTDDFGGVQLCDWGIARRCGEVVYRHGGECVQGETLVTHATIMGEVHGTPGYMAPEQVSKECPCDERTDVFGLGALLYDMIKGNPPLESKNLDDVEFPSEIKAICSKALSDCMKDRYQTVGQLIADINKYREGLVTIAENAGLWQILRKWVSRNKKMVSLAAVNLLALSIGLVVYIHTIQESENKLREVVHILHGERRTKQAERLTQAEHYYKQALRAANSGNTKFDFDTRDINLAHEMAVRSVELNPELHKAWGLLGEVKIVNRQYVGAVEAFKRAGEEFTRHFQLFTQFVEETPEKESLNQELFRLIQAAHKLRPHRLRNHLIFKRIQNVKTKREELEFCVEVMRITSGIDEIKWSYDEETATLDFSGSPVVHLSPVRRMRLTRLILRHNNLKGVELHNIRWMGLKYIDLSYGRVEHLKDFDNQEVEELHLEGCKITDITPLAKTKIKVLNIFNTPIELNGLKECESLEQVICSEEQATVLRNILPETVELIVKN